MRRAEIQALIDAVVPIGAMLLTMQPRNDGELVGLGVEYKGAVDPTLIVSKADKDASRGIKTALDSCGLFADHAYIDEEIRPSAADKAKKNRMIVDPLDGSSDYLQGGKGWGITLAQEDKQGVLRGIIYLPAQHVIYWGERGKGAFKIYSDKLEHDERLQLDRTPVGKPVIYTPGMVYMKTPGDQQRFANLSGDDCTLDCAGSASAHFAGILEGKADAFWAPALGEWDVKAGQLLVNEAGGKATLLSSERPGKVGMLAASHSDMHEWVQQKVSLGIAHFPDTPLPG